MKNINEAYLTGERALFGGQDLHITNTIFNNGESPLKQLSPSLAMPLPSFN